MQCAACNFENPPGMKFCGICGTQLNQACPRCRFNNPPNFQFCGQCGTALAEQPPALPDRTATQPNKPAAPAGERRQLTVMFSDLVGSTALSQQLDPEELHQVVRAYQAECVLIVNRFEGHVAQYLGDGLLVYFGYPLAHDDDALRAVRSGLGILETIERLSTRLQREKGLELPVRVGIHTGRVVVGEIGSGPKLEQLALGNTPNVAARLQNLAEPNTLVISAATYRLVQGYFATRNLGPKDLAGLTEPLTIFRVLHEQGVQNRLEAAAVVGLTPLVGREQELAFLLSRWDQVREGSGQVVSLIGEGGLGKSRLVVALRERLAEEAYLWLEIHCSPYHQHSALHPLIELLQQLLQFEAGDTPAQKLRKIEVVLARSGINSSLAEAVLLVANLLSVPLEENYAAVKLSPQRQKQLTLELILTMLLDTTTRRPVLFVMEDLHWVDPSTLEFIGLLTEQVSTGRLLVLFTFRPTFKPTWAARSYLTQLTLVRLPRKQAAQMIERIAGGKPFPGELLEQVIAKTDGVPLFLEELTKMVLELNLPTEAGNNKRLSSPQPILTIPTTLQDLLMARLDRLSTAKEVAQLAATLGRTFSYELLRAVSDLNETTLRRVLAQLVETELIYQRGLPPQATYTFKHSLIQEAAYRALLRSQRQQYHLKIAQILARQFPDTATGQPELLAHHYTAAGLKEEAVRCWQQAGTRAIARSANIEAIDHLGKGLELIETLPETPERLEQRLAMQIALGIPYLMTKGYAAPEVEHVYGQAWQLCQQMGDAPQLASALFGLWLFYLVRADYDMACRLGDQLMASAQPAQDPAILLTAHQVQGINSFYRGELILAREHLAQAIALYKPQRAFQPSYSGADTGVACLSHAALTLWLLGYPDQASHKIRAALSLAEALSHPFSQVFALSFAAWLDQYQGDGYSAQQRAEAAIAASTEQQFGLLLTFSIIFKGWGLAAQGHYDLGIAQMRQGIRAYLATGAKLGHLHFMALLAEAYGKAGQFETGLDLLDEALDEAGDKGERFYEAELYRLKGELLLQQARPQAMLAAETCFQQAIDVAQRQAAKSLALRAATNLSRLWVTQGKKAEAKQLLSDIYDRFSEGFETTDLIKAKELLQQSI